MYGLVRRPRQQNQCRVMPAMVLSHGWHNRHRFGRCKYRVIPVPGKYDPVSTMVYCLCVRREFQILFEKLLVVVEVSTQRRSLA